MWNYRIVRKEFKNHRNQVEYTYGIHEAFMDKNGKVVTVTQDAVEPFGQTVTELRNAWFMMMEAFGQPILDYNKIPEEGHDTKDPLVCVSNNLDVLPEEEQKKFEEEMRLDTQKIDWDEFFKEEEQKRLQCEKDHKESFMKAKKFNELFDAIKTQYIYEREQEDAIHKAE
jgi:hypothetical protein